MGLTAIGVNAQATNGARALAIGNLAQSGSTDSIVIGNNSVIGDTADKTTGADISTANAIAVGSKNKVTGANLVVFGKQRLGDGHRVPSSPRQQHEGRGCQQRDPRCWQRWFAKQRGLGWREGGSERKIVNVASGTADTDAVNVKQLNEKVAGIGTGGGTSLVDSVCG